jgi:hypothetical protein
VVGNSAVNLVISSGETSGNGGGSGSGGGGALDWLALLFLAYLATGSRRAATCTGVPPSSRR